MSRYSRQTGTHNLPSLPHDFGGHPSDGSTVTARFGAVSATVISLAGFNNVAYFAPCIASQLPKEGFNEAN